MCGGACEEGDRISRTMSITPGPSTITSQSASPVTFRLVDAYAQRARGGAAVPGVQGGPGRGADAVSLSRGVEVPQAAQQLVAATVSGGIDFTSGPTARPGAALPFYRRPGEQNAAATAIAIGRSLDVQG